MRDQLRSMHGEAFDRHYMRLMVDATTRPLTLSARSRVGSERRTEAICAEDLADHRAAPKMAVALSRRRRPGGSTASPGNAGRRRCHSSAQSIAPGIRAGWRIGLKRGVNDSRAGPSTRLNSASRREQTRYARPPSAPGDPGSVSEGDYWLCPLANPSGTQCPSHDPLCP
jgi:hypothetical protein